jgi:hypothetical protein
MGSSRRTFIEEALAAGLFAGLLSTSDIARADAEPDSPPLPSGEGAEGLRVEDAGEFWTHFCKSLDPKAPKSKGYSAQSERQVKFLQAGPGGLRYVEHIRNEELLDHPGDVQVSMIFDQLRPGSGDQSYLKKAKTSQFRVDCAQTKQFMEILPVMGWAAMAAIKPDQAGMIPSLKTLGFQSPDATSAVSQVLLPGGSGKIGVNVYSSKGGAFLQKLVSHVTPFAPYFAFALPAISIPALAAFSAIYSRLEEEASFMMCMPGGALAVATQHALEDPVVLNNPDYKDNPIPLVSGTYVLVPHAHVDGVTPHLENLQVLNGYVVQKPASNDPVEVLAAKAIPDVTYATVRVKVTPLSNISGSDSGSSAGTGGQTKPKGQTGSAVHRPTPRPT